MGEEVIDEIIKRLGELDTYYDNDYSSGNKEPMLLQKEVLEVLEQEREHIKSILRLEDIFALDDRSNLVFKLTKKGVLECEEFIRECAAKRKEILDAGKDTADDTELPTVEAIESELELFMDEDGDYYNGWGVTDNYNSDSLIGLRYGKDFIAYEEPVKEKSKQKDNGYDR
jgi:hypothetical protein